MSQTVTMRLPDETAEWLKTSARRVGRSVSELGATLFEEARRMSEFAADSEAHAGVLFVDETSIRSNDFGGLINTLLSHWQKYAMEDWSNRIAFLVPVPV